MENTIMNAKQGSVVLLLVVFVACGCASNTSSNVYSREEAQKAQRVDEGEVLFVREVTIEGSKSGLGGLAGGIMGFAIGGTVGGGSGRGVARAAGAVAGAAAGSAVEKESTRQTGLEITVQLDNGEVVAVVQAADEQFDVGDSVKVLRRPDGAARVIQ
jgi:outer membrane lipoprotein SlyB